MIGTINSATIPDWLGTAVIGAIIAALGYVGKLLIDVVSAIVARYQARQAQLAELLSLLMAGRAAYLVQCKNRDRLSELILKRDPDLRSRVKGFERRFAAAYPEMTEHERELHTIVRAITEGTLQPINTQLIAWLERDAYFRARRWDSDLRSCVAQQLAQLHAHLLIWQAKFAVWIPDRPEHALVYLVDEEKHGVGFPKKLQGNVQTLLNHRWWHLRMPPGVPEDAPQGADEDD